MVVYGDTSVPLNSVRDHRSYEAILRNGAGVRVSNPKQREHEDKTHKFTLPFVKRLEPRDKIDATLKYGEENIKMMEAVTNSLISRSIDDIGFRRSNDHTLETPSRNESIEYRGNDNTYRDSVISDIDSH